MLPTRTHLENHKLSTATLSAELAKSIQSRQPYGSIAVIAENPAAVLAATKKKWLRLIRLLENRQASSPGVDRFLNLQIAAMEGAVFTTRSPIERPYAHAWFGTPAQFLKCPPVATTLYVACDVDEDDRFRITRFMPEHGIVVVYVRGLPE